MMPSLMDDSKIWVTAIALQQSRARQRANRLSSLFDSQFCQYTNGLKMTTR